MAGGLLTVHSVVMAGRWCDHPACNRTARREDQLDLLLAPRAPVAVNRVFVDLGVQALLDILDQAASLELRPGELSLTATIDGQTMLDRVLNAFRNRPARPGCPGLATHFLVE